MFHPFIKNRELPLIPFLYDRVSKVLIQVLQIVIQDEKLDCNGSDLPNINLNEKSNLKISNQSHLGLANEAILEDLKSKDIVSRSDFQNFYEMFIKFFKTAASKLFQESPLNPVIVRTFRVFNPTLIQAENKLSLMKMMKSLTQQLHMLGMISANIGDNAYDQYDDLVKADYDSVSYKDSDRLDGLLFQTLKIEQVPELAQSAMIIF